MNRLLPLLLACLAAGPAAAFAPPAGASSQPGSRPAGDDVRAYLRQNLQQARAAGLEVKVLRRLVEKEPSPPPAGPDEIERAQREQAVLEMALAFIRDIHPRLPALRQRLGRAGMKPQVLDALVRTAVSAFNDGEMGQGEEEFPRLVGRIQGAVRLAEQAADAGGDRALAALRDRAIGAFNGGHFGRGAATFDARLVQFEEALGNAVRHPVAATRPGEKPAEAAAPVQLLLDLHNQVRLRHNLHALKLEPRLTAAAQKYAEFMARTGKYGHYEKGNPGQRVMDEGYRFRSVGENYAAGVPTAESALQAWLASPTHRQTMLGGYVHAGFGLARNQHGQAVWVAVFSIPR